MYWGLSIVFSKRQVFQIAQVCILPISPCDGEWPFLDFDFLPFFDLDFELVEESALPDPAFSSAEESTSVLSLLAVLLST